MSDHSITNHIASYDVYGTSDSIFGNFSIPKIVIYLLQFSDRPSTSIQDK